MTKHLYIAAAVALALSVSACGRDDNRDTAPYGPTSSTNTNTGGPSSPSGQPLVTGEGATSSSSSAIGGTSGLGASGTAEGGTSTSTPGVGGTGSASGSESGGSSLSPGSNTSAGEGAGMTPDAERSKQR